MDKNGLRKQWGAVTKQLEAAILPPRRWQDDLYFQTKTHHNIRYGYAPALQKDKRGTVVLTHGYSESIDCYYEDIKKYQKIGFEVYALEWHGYGRSGRAQALRPDIPSCESLTGHVYDLNDFIEGVVWPPRTKKDKPLFMSTNSMGGHIGLLYLHDHPDIFDGAIMSTPLFDFKPLWGGPMMRPITKALFNLASHMGLRDVHIPLAANDGPSPTALGKVENILSGAFGDKDKETNYRREIHKFKLGLDKDSVLGSPTIGWVVAACKTIKTSMKKEFLEKITTPVLMGSGGDEPYVDNKFHEWAAGMMPHARNVVIPGAGHTLWRESDSKYDLWWSHVEDFIKSVEALKPAPEKKSFFSWLPFGKTAPKTNPQPSPH